MVYGSAYSRKSISYKLEERVLNRYYRVVNSRQDNCALVLYAGEYAIIEFSGSGALYVYKKGSEETADKIIEYLAELIKKPGTKKAVLNKAIAWVKENFKV